MENDFTASKGKKREHSGDDFSRVFGFDDIACAEPNRRKSIPPAGKPHSLV
jgi:hypothetical protein